MKDELLEKLSEYESPEEEARLKAEAEATWRAHKNSMRNAKVPFPPDAATDDALIYEEKK